MEHFTVRTAAQLPMLLQAFRKNAGLTQSEVALRLGVTQQTYSALERNAEQARPWTSHRGVGLQPVA